MRRWGVRPAAAFVATGLVLAACADDGQDAADDRGAAPTGPDRPGDATTTRPEPPGGDAAARLCAGASRVGTGTVASPDAAEISGVVVSRRQDAVLWAHNDSGFPAELLAVGADGSDLGTFPVPGAESIDWEDIALGPGPEPGVDYLYVGDIGDNIRVLFDRDVRSESPVTIYRLPEPDVGGGAVETATPTAFPVVYEDDYRDAEALLLDPLTGDLLVVSKEWGGDAAGVYRLPAEIVLADEAPDGVTTLARVGELVGSEGQLVTGGDVSADGRVVAIRTYPDVWLWDRDPEASVADTLATEPACRLAVDEPQGEAVGIAPDTSSFVTISEGDHPPVLWHELP